MSETPTNPHDAFFRALMDDPARAEALIREYLPAEIADRLTDDPPELVDGNYVDEELRGSQSDRLFKVRLTSGKPALLYVLLEHKSTPEARTPIQVLGYMARIWERHAEGRAEALRALPPIIPLVVYHGERRWTVPTSVFECIDADPEMMAHMRELRYVLRDLGPIEDAALSKSVDLRAGLAALKHAFDRGAPVELLASILAQTPDAGPLERQLLRYIVQVYRTNSETLRAAIEHAKPKRAEELMNTVAEEWLERGKAEGKAEGKASMLLRMLERRFGPVPETVRSRIKSSGDAQLDAWADAALDANSLDDVLAARPDT